MKLKRILAFLAATSLSIAAIPFSATADEATDYGSAGIAFQLRDTWEHRDAVNLASLDETGEQEINLVFNDTKITGNGSYEISVEGCPYTLGDDYENTFVGFVGVDTELDFEEYGETNEDFQITIDEFIYDDKTYKPTDELVPVKESNDKCVKDYSSVTVKCMNTWGDFNLNTDSVETWIEKCTIKFTVSGLPTDREGEQEVVVNTYGTPDDDSSAEDSVESNVDSSDSSVADSDSKTVDNSSSSVADKDSDSNNVLLFVGIGAAAVVVVVVIVIIVKKK